jgi:predicted amidophosphoribosyltransferase
MRVYRPPDWKRGLHHSERVCCADCLRTMSNARANEQRRVRHVEINCEVCGEEFTPRRGDATTCSNASRQKLYRQRHRGATY